MNKKFLNTKIEGLAKRSQNIINELGGIGQLLDFYNKHKSFLSLPKAGRFTDNELTSFCNDIINKGGLEKIEVDRGQDKNIIDMDKAMAIYENEKPLLSKRLNNILQRLEHEYEYNHNTENKVEYIEKLFISDMDYLTIQNLGLKSKLELELVKDKILSGRLIPTFSDEETCFKKDPYQSVNKAFPILFSDEEKEDLFTDGRYSFKKMLCIFLFFNTKIKKLPFQVLIDNFFKESRTDNKLLALKLNCSLERIRQIDHYLDDVTIPWAINTLLDSFEGKPYDLPSNNNSDVVYFNAFPEFSFRSFNYTPNVALSKSVYRFILRDNYQLIDELIINQYKSLRIPEKYFFISKKIIQETDLVYLLNWIDDQIYQFEIVGFGYKLEVLIKRFYDENQKQISQQALKILHSIILKIKRETIELSDNIVLKRNTRKSQIDNILNEVYSFLKEKNESQMANVILDHLNQKNLVIEKHNLLRYLNNHKSTFTSFGMGNWTLVEWKNNENLSGSFREIVRKLLFERSDPIHVSELFEYLNTMKKVSLHSITSNLKVETEGTFNFFNCSYIGLSAKHYSDFWYQIPKIKPVHINKKVFPINGKNEEEKINDVCSKYGYPKQHIKFILDCRRGKYI